MARHVTRVADRADDDQAFFDGALYGLRQGIIEIRHFVVAPGRDIDDANAILFAVGQYPLYAALYVALGDAARSGKLHEHDARLGRDPSIETVRETAVPGGHHGGHHPVPAGRIGRVQRGLVAQGLRKAVVGENAILGRGKVFVRVKARIQKGYGDAATLETIIRVETQRRRKNVPALLEDGGVRF
jgi:hypothetical protein